MQTKIAIMYHCMICGLDNFYLQLTSQCKYSKMCIWHLLTMKKQNILSLVEKFYSLNTILIEMFFVLQGIGRTSGTDCCPQSDRSGISECGKIQFHRRTTRLATKSG